ncbi:MAG: SulP family inorganic anion transporter [Actinobacteria bacterium]|nr:SulP family inorganic anion transporter [Actinomycetota bacterium]
MPDAPESTPSAPAPPKRRLPVLQGILPLDRTRLPMDIAAGVTLAALGIPEVMGYTSIAGMPVITGLYTILIPILVFALLGSSRHLVVGADSASAAILAAGLAGLAPVASPQYVALAGWLAIMTGVILLLARLVKLGFIADFLSRSVLVGFLTGVGIQVAIGQVGDMLGIPPPTYTKWIDASSGTVEKFLKTLRDIGDANAATIWVSVGVIVVTVGAKLINPRIPGALIAVIGAIFVSWQWDLAADGVSTLGKVPGGLPAFGLPDYAITWSQFTSLLPTAFAIFIVILAQSAATSRAYAARYEEQFDENVDLDGLALANVSAGLSGTFVVNGSPTKSQMVDGAGGRSQVAMVTTSAIILVVLLFFTKPLQYMPNAVLASVVFIIGIELIDVAGMRRIWRARRDEFAVAALTALVVVTVGVEQAILVAIVLSILDHLRRGYHPNDAVLVENDAGHFHATPVAGGTTTRGGVVVYRFAADLYYANTNRFNEEILELVGEGAPDVTALVLDAGVMFDVDYSGGETLKQAFNELHDRGVKLLIANALPSARSELDRYGVTELIGGDAYFESYTEAIEAAGGTTSA